MRDGFQSAWGAAPRPSPQAEATVFDQRRSTSEPCYVLLERGERIGVFASPILTRNRDHAAHWPRHLVTQTSLKASPEHSRISRVLQRRLADPGATRIGRIPQVNDPRGRHHPRARPVRTLKVDLVEPVIFSRRTTAHRPTGAGQQLDTTIGGNVDGEHALPGPAQGSRRLGAPGRRESRCHGRCRGNGGQGERTAPQARARLQGAQTQRRRHRARRPRQQPAHNEIGVGAGAHLDLRGGASRSI